MRRSPRGAHPARRPARERGRARRRASATTICGTATLELALDDRPAPRPPRRRPARTGARRSTSPGLAKKTPPGATWRESVSTAPATTRRRGVRALGQEQGAAERLRDLGEGEGDHAQPASRSAAARQLAGRVRRPHALRCRGSPRGRVRPRGWRRPRRRATTAVRIAASGRADLVDLRLGARRCARPRAGSRGSRRDPRTAGGGR